jgi:hypothetical protein
VSDTPTPVTTDDVAAAEAEQAARGAQIEASMEAAGVSSTTPVQADYFAFEEYRQVPLPDGTSWVQIKALNEGDKRKYLNSINREVKIGKITGDATMSLATGEEREAILRASICGWNLQRGGQPVPFSKHELDGFLSKGNPKIFDIIEKEIRSLNTWLLSDVTVEDIDKQIEELEELRAVKVREEEGNAL